MGHKLSCLGIAAALYLLLGAGESSAGVCEFDRERSGSEAPPAVPTSAEELEALRSEVGVRVVKLVAEHLGISAERAAQADDLGRDAGADCLDQVELVMALEEEFGIEIPDDAAEGLTNTRRMALYVWRSTRPAPTGP